MSPTTTEEWIAVARERAADADALLTSRQASAGPVYFAGYAIECSLKAHLQSKGIPLPKKGREGHNLRNLWKMAGFRLSDIGDHDGAKAFFTQEWSTDLRYTTNPEFEFSSTELVAAARKLSGWVQNIIRRRGGRI